MNSELNQLIDDCEKYISQNGIDENIIETYYNVCQLAKNEGEIDTMLKCTARTKELIEKACMRDIGIDIFELEKYTFNNNIDNDLVNRYFDTLLLEAPHLFHSYLLYLEKDREESERFYQPKMKQLNKYGLIQAMQDLEDDKYNRLCISMPPGTQKTTLEKFFCSWIIGKHPKDYSLFFSHSNEITGKFYKGVLDITTDDKEYKWNVIFPNLPLQSTNAQAQEANFGKYKAFSSIQCSSIGAKNAGKVRTNRYLYCDDLIGSIEEALNPIILEKIWRIYGVDLKQRKLNEQVKEIIIMTRWSTKDIIGHIIELYGNDPKLKIISIPDIDPKTGKSNFDYEYNGMSVEFFNDQALTMDDISYRCLYKQDPIEREGLLFPDDKIRRYLNLPHGEPEIITAQCDTKGKGTDYFVLPVLQKYGEDYYCIDCVCDNTADYEEQYRNAAGVLVNNKVQECEFERNAGGDRVAMEVNKRVESVGWICNITDTPTETNKEARIFQCSNWILQHIIFKDPSLYKPNEPYGVMMSLLKQYSVSGKKQLDDVPDVFSNFALRMTQGNRTAKVEAAINPFRRY